MSSLTILNVAYPFAPVGPDCAGGAEQILTEIDSALTTAGHTSVVIACRGSQVTGTLEPTGTPPALIDDAARRTAYAEYRTTIATAINRWRPDLVHLHGLDFYEYLPGDDIPTLVTLHLPALWLNQRVFSVKRPRTWFQCVSQSQKRDMPAALPISEVIENGVRVDALRRSVTRRPFALTVGRVCPEKGLHLAMEAARTAAFPLLVAGPVFPYGAHQEYFDREIVPRLTRSCRYIGPIGYRRKRRLMNAAQCVVIPSVAPETSSLVAMEALACGAPVVAFPSGALADVVEPGVTGFLVRTIPEMADAIIATDRLSAERCREEAARRFDARRMTTRYLDLYRRILVGAVEYASDGNSSVAELAG